MFYPPTSDWTHQGFTDLGSKGAAQWLTKMKAAPQFIYATFDASYRGAIQVWCKPDTQSADERLEYEYFFKDWDTAHPSAIFPPPTGNLSVIPIGIGGPSVAERKFTYFRVYPMKKGSKPRARARAKK